MLFSEALTEPLRGWVKAYKPSTLLDAINRARDLQDSVLKNRFPLKTNFPVKDKDITFSTGMAKENLVG